MWACPGQGAPLGQDGAQGRAADCARELALVVETDISLILTWPPLRVVSRDHPVFFCMQPFTLAGVILFSPRSGIPVFTSVECVRLYCTSVLNEPRSRCGRWAPGVPGARQVA